VFFREEHQLAKFKLQDQVLLSQEAWYPD